MRRHAGVWRRTGYVLVRITGADIGPWLNNVCTNDVARLETGEGCAGAILDYKGRIDAHFTVHRWDDEFWLLVEQGLAPRLLERLDGLIFREDVQLEDAGAETGQVVVQGPRSLPLLAPLVDEEACLLPREPYACAPVLIAGHQALAFRISVTGEDGFVFVTATEEVENLIEGVRQADSKVLRVGEDGQDVLRIEAGLPLFERDMDHTTIIAETPLDAVAVNYDKGCFLGQEVLARIQSQGSPKRFLMGLVLDAATAEPPQDGASISVDGKRAGIVKSVTHSPTLKSWIALAYMGREHRTPGQTLSFVAGDSEATHTAHVVMLPFHNGTDRLEQARKGYVRALEAFHRDMDDTDTSVIDLLKEAILFDPVFEDAYETLGVVLQRHQRIDEAIHYMQALAQLNPDCAMAHTNLSVFYLAKGMIEEAESEKAQAALLQMKERAGKRKAEEMARAERKRIELEARQRIEMFREVLEIDPDDAVAAFGMGSSYIQLKDYANAIPYLTRATEREDDFSAAFLSLGKCHEFLGHNKEASAAYEAGIAAASRKGDFMPLQEMERRLRGLGTN